MTKEQAREVLRCNTNLGYGIVIENESTQLIKEAIEMAIKALEQDNKEIFKQFKKKVFLESEDVLGNEMVDSYMITDYLAELIGVEND